LKDVSRQKRTSGFSKNFMKNWNGSKKRGSSSTFNLKNSYRKRRKSIMETKVVIVGAGLSGIMAARTLMESGVTDILLVEKSRSVGWTARNEADRRRESRPRCPVLYGTLPGAPERSRVMAPGRMGPPLVR